MARAGSIVRGLALALLCMPGAATASVLEAGAADAPGIRSVYQIAAADLTPGSTIRLHAGTYAAPIVIPISGSLASPIIVEGAGDGTLRMATAIALDGASDIVLRHLALEGAGIVLIHGAHDVTITENAIADARLGIWIGNGAGDHNLIQRNVITRSKTHGIAVDGVNATPGRETVIAENRISDSGIHGIELSGNYYVIDGNIVQGNGRASTGASGIHIYAHDAHAGVGKHNVIRNNIALGTHDASAQDGNGIQLDQWCDDNIVINNIAAGNDGAGISVFDAANSRVEQNTLYGNMRDPGDSHRHKGELTFATDDEHDIDRTRDDVARDNIVIATNPQAAAILVDSPTSRHAPEFSGNLLGAENGATLAQWNGSNVTTITAWNVLAPHSVADAAGNPRFIDPAHPTRGGFALEPGQNSAWRTLGWRSAQSPP